VKGRQRDGAPLQEGERMRRHGSVGLLARRRAVRWQRQRLRLWPEEGVEGAGRVGPNGRVGRMTGRAGFGNGK
jgi:hypothetical protein